MKLVKLLANQVITPTITFRSVTDTEEGTFQSKRKMENDIVAYKEIRSIVTSGGII